MAMMAQDKTCGAEVRLCDGASSDLHARIDAAEHVPLCKFLLLEVA